MIQGIYEIYKKKNVTAARLNGLGHVVISNRIVPFIIYLFFSDGVLFFGDSLHNSAKEPL